MNRLSHFISINDFTTDQITALLDLAHRIKAESRECRRQAYLKDCKLAMIFQKPSNRTRLSFDTGMYELGGYALNIQPHEIQMGIRESIPDVARTVSRFVDGIMIRANQHQDIELFKEYSSVPVINGLSDRYHPCQVLADIMTIQEKSAAWPNPKIVYIGDGNNVCNSLINICHCLGLKLTVATPKTHKPEEPGDFTYTDSVREAVQKAHVIYTDTWVSMGQEKERAKRIREFEGFKVDRALMNLADKDCLFMHCLPAHRGEEVTDEVMEGSSSVVFDQAENRKHAQKAVLVSLLKGE